jgi:hypothetical protein
VVSNTPDPSSRGWSFLVALLGDPDSLNLAIIVAVIQADGSLAGWLTAARLLVEVRRLVEGFLRPSGVKERAGLARGRHPAKPCSIPC